MPRIAHTNSKAACTSGPYRLPGLPRAGGFSLGGSRSKVIAVLAVTPAADTNSSSVADFAAHPLYSLDLDLASSPLAEELIVCLRSSMEQGCPGRIHMMAMRVRARRLGPMVYWQPGGLAKRKGHSPTLEFHKIIPYALLIIARCGFRYRPCGSRPTQITHLVPAII